MMHHFRRFWSLCGLAAASLLMIILRRAWSGCCWWSACNVVPSASERAVRARPIAHQALTGTFDAHHAQLAKSMLRRLELVEQAMAELDAVIAEACRPWQHQLELLQT